VGYTIEGPWSHSLSLWLFDHHVRNIFLYHTFLPWYTVSHGPKAIGPNNYGLKPWVLL
jgi:hypothetical protein